MPVFLSHSLTAALSGGTASEQEAVLLDLARRRPRVSFYDVLREREQTIPVLVAGGRVERIEHDSHPTSARESRASTATRLGSSCSSITAT